MAMLSMTGYGRGEYKADGLELIAEIKTVNNRYLDISVKAPKIFTPCEEIVRSLVKGKLTRGHAEIFITLTDRREKPKSVYIDEGAAKSYAEAAKKLKELCPELVNDFTIYSLMRMPDVIRQDEGTSADEELIEALKSALISALDALNVMREKEGKKLADDMLSRMNRVEKLVGEIVKRAPLVAVGYKERLKEKIERYLDGVEYDEGRLLTEVSIFADKSNIDEELTRLSSHIAQFRDICKESLVGRKLDFLVQEFNREANTICSKSNDLAITRSGLDLKNEIEKIREQVQNVE